MIDRDNKQSNRNDRERRKTKCEDVVPYADDTLKCFAPGRRIASEFRGARPRLTFGRKTHVKENTV